MPMTSRFTPSPLSFIPVFLAIAIFFLSCGGGATLQPPPAKGWTLVWSDEFNGPDGSAPDSSKWTYDTGGKGWGNKELECYTNRLQNAQVKSGNLVITAQKESITCSDGVSSSYTSARLKTQGLFSQAYGRFEARIKIPAGQGMWPAFWMLGNDITSAGWPKCGEIDIMENIGKEPGKVHVSLHGPGASSGTSDLTTTYTLPPEQKFGDDFHIFAVEWEPDIVRFYVHESFEAAFRKTRGSADFPVHSTTGRPSVGELLVWKPGSPWVFVHPFFLILNVAVGGDWPGSPENTTQFPQQMLVDYVRVYTKQ